MRRIAARMRRIAAALPGSRYLRLGIAALLFGAALLGFNFGNEYAALGGETPFRELPSVRSMLKRFGQDAEYNVRRGEHIAWGNFLSEQLRRLGQMALPYVLTVHSGGLDYPHPPGPLNLPYAAIGLAAAGACLLGLLFAGRGRLPLAALALAGLCWGFGMRFNTALPHHSFEAVFYIGIPLALFTLLLRALRRQCPALPVMVAVAALPVLILSAWQHGRVEAQSGAPGRAAFQADLMSDYQEIRRLTQGNRVYRHSDYIELLSPGQIKMVSYYLAGSVIKYDERARPFCDPACEPGRDFVVGGKINPGDSYAGRPAVKSLTPANRVAFLYDAADVAALYRGEYDAIRSGGYGPPAVRSVFDVYLGGGKLIYYKEQCADADTEPRFTLHFIPRDAADLPEGRRESGFENRDFDFAAREKRLGGACWATAPLPDYPVARIRAGQSVQGEALWQAEINPSWRGFRK